MAVDMAVPILVRWADLVDLVVGPVVARQQVMFLVVQGHPVRVTRAELVVRVLGAIKAQAAVVGPVQLGVITHQQLVAPGVPEYLRR